MCNKNKNTEQKLCVCAQTHTHCCYNLCYSTYNEQKKKQKPKMFIIIPK